MKLQEELSASDVSRETMDHLTLYSELLAKWNPAINLVAKSTIADAWSRHFIDSIQLFHYGSSGPNWADLGSGGGFPGMVIAILGGEWRPDLCVTLVESDQRKAAFLREVALKTQTRVQILNERAENLPPIKADTLTARAFAPLKALLPYVERHLNDDGVALLQKGARYREELSEAKVDWKFNHEVIQSQTDTSAVILKVRGLRRG